MKVEWKKETPTVEGWYWVKYRGGQNQMVKCPASVIVFKSNVNPDEPPTNMVRSARNDSWIEGPNHGGYGLKYNGKLDKTLRFGPMIEIPE